MAKTKKVVDGNVLTNCTEAYTCRVEDFHLSVSIYASLLMRYMAQYQMVGSCRSKTVSVLDVGCANGAAARLYATSSLQFIGRKKIMYTGVDLDVDSLEDARKNAPSSSCILDYNILEANISDPWTWARDSQYEVIWYTEVIEHVKVDRAESTLREAHRVCEPGGRMMLATPARLGDEMVWPDSHDHEFTREEVRDMLAATGWRVINEWGVYANWTRVHKLLSPEQKEQYSMLRDCVGRSFATAVMQVLHPDASEDLVWLCEKR